MLLLYMQEGERKEVVGVFVLGRRMNVTCLRLMFCLVSALRESLWLLEPLEGRCTMCVWEFVRRRTVELAVSHSWPGAPLVRLWGLSCTHTHTRRHTGCGDQQTEERTDDENSLQALSLLCRQMDTKTVGLESRSPRDAT